MSQTVIESKMKNTRPTNVAMKSPNKVQATDLGTIALQTPPAYTLGEKVATRLAYGTAIAKLGANNQRVVALDADTKNSTYSDKFKKAHPDRFVECFIAEQNLVGKLSQHWTFLNASQSIGTNSTAHQIDFCTNTVRASEWGALHEAQKAGSKTMLVSTFRLQRCSSTCIILMIHVFAKQSSVTHTCSPQLL